MNSHQRLINTLKTKSIEQLIDCLKDLKKEAFDINQIDNDHITAIYYCYDHDSLRTMLVEDTQLCPLYNQYWLLMFLISVGYDIDDGACFGITNTAIEALLLNDFLSLNKRFKKMFGLMLLSLEDNDRCANWTRDYENYYKRFKNDAQFRSQLSIALQKRLASDPDRIEIRATCEKIHLYQNINKLPCARNRCLDVLRSHKKPSCSQQLTQSKQQQPVISVKSTLAHPEDHKKERRFLRV